MTRSKRILCISIALLMALAAAACGSRAENTAGSAQEETTTAIAPVIIDSPEPMTEAPATEAETEAEPETEETDDIGEASDAAEETAVEKNGDVYILYTSDIHCGVDQGFGIAGLWQIRDTLEKQGYTVLLVDDGDAIQGELMGTLSRGEAMIDLMNELHYDVAIPGNHEFSYGADRFMELTRKAEFPYICCNFLKEGEQVFPSYIIKEAAGIRIAFVGVVTPTTIVSAAPAYFQNEQGEFIYSFMQEDKTGEEVYQAVQQAVDDARAEGADYVYIMGHLGMGSSFSPWNYADVISHTNGIDVFLDGHSHDTEQVVMKNKDGKDVVRSACGTKMNCIGYSHISATDGIRETNIWTWQNKESLPALLGISNEAETALEAVLADTEKTMNEVIADSSADLLISDPVEKDDNGNPIQMIRRAETNLGDFCADAYRIRLNTDIAIVNGGAIRTDLLKGDVTYGDVVSVFPFGNQAAVIAATGQQILDALEWGAKAIPDEFGGFLQVSGMSYEVDVSIPSPCTSDENKMMEPISGKRRVSNVMIGDEPIDPEKIYTVGGASYVLQDNGDGMTAFNGAELVKDKVMLDSQILINYIMEDLGGTIGEDYADPYGAGRITIRDQ